MSVTSAVSPSGATALGDRALAELCRLLEQTDPKMAPDAIWLCGDSMVFEHLRDIEALTLANDLAGDLVCHECGVETFRPQAGADVEGGMPYRGYCPECGWVGLTPEQARPWQVHPVKIARWLGTALRLTPRYAAEPVIDGVLWRLGEAEYRRRRHTLFFGRLLAESADAVGKKLDELAAPGAEIVFTTSDVTALRSSALSNRLLVPLRAVTHLRKAGLVVENIDAYLTGAGRVAASDETSLRLMHTRRIALIDGEEHKLSPQVYAFLKVLEDADGDEVNKRYLAEALELDEGFRKADVFKRHKLVFDTFAEADNKGNYWLKPEFVILDRR